MQDTLLFFLSDEALAAAQSSGMGAQLLGLLAERTGSAWHMTDADRAVETVPPYRGIRAWGEIDGSWHAFQNGVATRCLRVTIDSSETNSLSGSFLGFEAEPVAPPALAEAPQSIAGLAQQFFAARHSEVRTAAVLNGASMQQHSLITPAS